MKINIPDGLDITPEDMKRKEIEALATFEINEEDGELTLTSIDGVPVMDEEMEDEMEGEEEGEEMEAETEGGEMPTQEETIGEFVRGQLAKRK